MGLFMSHLILRLQSPRIKVCGCLGVACRFCGYEVTTEGDSFTIAFHDAFDAVVWALATQRAMLEAEWPQAILDHDKAGVQYSSKENSTRPGELLFRGLRVRMAITTGKDLEVLVSWLVWCG
jgi:class 3 adenylate cyclase